MPELGWSKPGAASSFRAAMTDTTARPRNRSRTPPSRCCSRSAFCHLLNDMMQAVLPAIYPTLKADFHLSFAQIGLITAGFQCTASLLQPAVGFRRRQQADALFAGAGHGLHPGRAGRCCRSPAAIRWCWSPPC